ncbi:diguanylate cyclase, partial [Acinetobacter baumannii]
GDEFAVWLEEADVDGARGKAQAIVAFGQSLDVLHGVAGKPLGVSGGVVMSDPVRDISSDVLLARADTAMYQAKRAGKGQVAIGDDS